MHQLTQLLVTALAVVASLATSTPACAAATDARRDSASPRGTFVGAVAGTEAAIGLVSDGERVTGYLCSDDRVSTWLDVIELEDGSAALVNRRGDPVGTVAFGRRTASASASASATVTVDGETHTVRLRRARGDAGVFRATHGEPGTPGSVEVGWIVLPDGTIRGAKTSFIDSESDFVVGAAPAFIDQEGNLLVDLGPGAESTEVVRITPGFIESGSDI